MCFCYSSAMQPSSAYALYCNMLLTLWTWRSVVLHDVNFMNTVSVISVLDTNGYLQSIYFITQQHMRIHFATILLTAMRKKAHANHNGSERYSTYRQHDSAFSGLCGIMKMDWPGIHSVASAHYSSSPWSVLPWRWKLYSPIKHEHLYSYVGSLRFLWTRETISLLGSVLHID